VSSSLANSDFLKDFDDLSESSLEEEELMIDEDEMPTTAVAPLFIKLPSNYSYDSIDL